MIPMLLSAGISACLGVAALAATTFVVWKLVTHEYKWVFMYIASGSFVVFVLGLGAVIVFGPTS